MSSDATSAQSSLTLNCAPLPEIRADAVVGLGLLEYLHDIPSLLAHVPTVTAIAVFSYNIVDAEDRPGNRLSHGWVNDLTSAELEERFRAAGTRFNLEP